MKEREMMGVVGKRSTDIGAAYKKGEEFGSQ
jgi:hypothetical protein